MAGRCNGQLLAPFTVEGESIIQALEKNDGFLCSIMVILSEIGSDVAIPTLQQIIKSHAYDYSDEPEDGSSLGSLT
jgi:hypothetical protein